MSTGIILVDLKRLVSRLSPQVLRLLDLQQDLPRGATPTAPLPDRPVTARERLGPAVVVQLVAEYRGGDSTKTLAKRYGLGQGTVVQLLHQEGAVMRNQGLPAERIGEAAALYCSGWSQQRLAERYGCDAKTIATTLKRHGVQMRRPWERVE
jgi:hypothetical protein